MKKFYQRCTMLLLLLPLLNQSISQAQLPCPMKVYNNGTTFGLTFIDPNYTDFVDGNYWLTMSWFENPDCLNFSDQYVAVTKTANLQSVIPGAAPTKGITFTINNQLACASLGNNQFTDETGGSLSIILQKSNGTEFLTVNFTAGIADECPYIAFPVTFGPFTLTPLTSPTRYKLNWTTYTELQMGHFSIEKSIDGANFYKIGEVAATNNSSGSSYEFIDNSPTNKNFYRIVSVDLNCYKQNTNIVWINCSTCPTTFTPPSITPDCNLPTPSPYLSGPASICDTSGKVFRLNDLKGEAQVTWSVSPASLATLIQAGRMVTVKRTTFSGLGTLTATVVKGGITSTYSKSIVFGTPPLYVSSSSTPVNICTNTYQLTASVNMLPNTYSSQYKWYNGSSYLGSGSSKTWTLTAGQSFSYTVKYDGPCGQSVGGVGGGVIEVRAAAPRFAASSSSAQSGIQITLLKPACPRPLTQARGSDPAAGQMLDIKVFDMYGNLKKTTREPSTGTRFTINSSNLPTGLYYVHIVEPGKETSKLKVWVGK